MQTKTALITLLWRRNSALALLIAGAVTFGGPVKAAETVNKLALNSLLALPLDALFNVSISTASKHAEDINDTPATVYVVTRQQMDTRRYLNLADLLQDLPGVDMFRQTKSTIYHNITLRGHQTNSKFMILQDGVKIEAPDDTRIPVADNYPLAHVKRVEVIYGPASALYGADAFAGVINLITETGKDLQGLRVSTRIGTDNYQYYQAQGGLKLDKDVDIMVAAHAHNADMENLADSYPQAFPKVDAVTFAGHTAIPAAAREDYAGPVSSNSALVKLNLTPYLTLGYHNSFFRSLTSTGDRPDTALYHKDGQWNTEIESLYAKFRYDFNERLSTELLLDYQRFEILPTSKFTNIYVDFQDIGYEYAYSRKEGIEQQFTYRWDATHTFIAGLSYADHYALPQVPDLPAPFDTHKSPDQQHFYYPNTDLPIEFVDVHYNNRAAYAQWQAAWSPKFSTTVGLRYDDNSRYESTLNPRLGLVYRPSPRLIWKFLYGEAFRAPSPDEGLSTFGSFSGAQDANGNYLGGVFRATNHEIQPEKSRNLELSLSKAVHDNLTLTASAYYSEVDNLIVTRNQIPPNQFIPGAILSKTSIKDNAGNERHWGLDLGTTYQHAFANGVQAQFWGSYSYIDGDVQETPTSAVLTLPYIAPHKFKLGTTFTYRNYFITGKLSLVDRSHTGLADRNHPGERLTTPGYAVFDLHLGAPDIYKNLSLNLDIYNLFDTHYYAAAGSASTTFVSMPQATRSLMFSVGYRFD